MTDEMRRLKEERGSAFARSLLDSAGDDRPPDGAGGRALASLGIGAAGMAAAGAAKAAGALVHGATSATGSIAPAAKLGALVLVKWVGVGVLSAVVVAGSVAVVRSRAEPGPRTEGTTPSVTVSAEGPRAASHRPPDPVVHPGTDGPQDMPGGASGAKGSASPASVASPSTPAAASSAIVREAVTVAPQPPPARATPPDSMHPETTAPNSIPPASRVDTESGRPPSMERAPAFGGDSVTRQLGALAEVRRALVAHDPARALELLRAFDEHYPTSAIGEEVMVVRIDALVDAGRTSDAAALADIFLGRYPESPSADHVRKKVRAP